MSRDDNYPDNIHDFDNHPNSPFFIDPNEWMQEATENLAQRWYDEYLLDGRIYDLGYDVDDITILLFSRKAKTVYNLIFEEAAREVSTYPGDHHPEPNFEALDWD